FSSRRRHTRWPRDWSSDVCSSDLQQYHDFIGFEVSKSLLERAFLKTYDLPLEEVLRPLDFSIGTFRRAASTIIPELTRVALEVRSEERRVGKECRRGRGG